MYFVIQKHQRKAEETNILEDSPALPNNLEIEGKNNQGNDYHNKNPKDDHIEGNNEEEEEEEEENHSECKADDPVLKHGYFSKAALKKITEFGNSYCLQAEALAAKHRK